MAYSLYDPALLRVVVVVVVYVTSFLSISCLSNSEHWSQKTSIFKSVRLYNNNIYKTKHCLTHVKDFYWEL